MHNQAMSFIRCFVSGVGLAWGSSHPSQAPSGPPPRGGQVALPPSRSALEQANGLGPLVFGRPLPTLLEEVSACHVVAGERVACLAAGYTVAVDRLRLTGPTLLHYTGRLYGIYLPPCRPADTPTLLRWLRQHYGPGQALGQGQFWWQGSRVSVVYKPLLSGPGCETAMVVATSIVKLPCSSETGDSFTSPPSTMVPVRSFTITFAGSWKLIERF